MALSWMPREHGMKDHSRHGTEPLGHGSTLHRVREETPERPERETSFPGSTPPGSG